MASMNSDIRVRSNHSRSLSVIAGVAIFSLIMSLFASLMPITVSAAEIGFKSPTDTDSANDWNSENNAFTSNNVYAFADHDGYDQGYDEFGGFALPSGATVDGILVEIDAKQEGTSCQLQTRLSWNNGSSFTSYKTLVPTSSETTLSYGGSADTWGHTWTATNLLNSNFVVEIQYNDPGSGCDTDGGSRDSISVDVIRVKVFYTPANNAPSITLTGSSVALSVGDTYVEPGFSANDTEDGDITANVVVSGTVNTGAVGSYTLHYNVSDSNSAAAPEQTRMVTVSDVDAPVVTVTPATQTIEATGPSGATASYTVTALDNVDGDLTASTTCSVASGSMFALGTNTIDCSVTDSSSLVGNGSATVIVEDTTAPVITLTGAAAISLNVGDTYTEEGATATDTVDGTVSVTIGGDVVDGTTVGTYVVTYNAVDAHGNNATQVTRTITVTAPAPAPAPASNGGNGGGGGGGIVSGPLSIGFVNTNPTTGGQVLGASTEVPSTELPAGCSAYLGSYLKKGTTNSSEVKKLQIFLNKNLGLSLPVTGTFGPATFDAVNKFQVKYSDEVLKPWFVKGLSKDMDPSGYVYKTTKHKINLLECATLNAPEPVLP